VQRRFKWSLFGLRPFIDVQQSNQAHEPLVLQFSPALYRVASVEDVLREQQIASDERDILERLLQTFGRTRQRRASAIPLGTDPRTDLALRSLLESGDVELLGTSRVV
jgi:hypothetical protein